MKKAFEIPHIPEDQRTPLVDLLIEIIQKQFIIIEEQHNRIQLLEDEIKRLKGHTSRPDIPKSIIEKTRDDNKNNEENSEDADTDISNNEKNNKQKNGDTPKKKRKKRPKNRLKKKKNLIIHEEKVIPVDISEEDRNKAKKKGFQYFSIQDLKIVPHNTRIARERLQLENGQYVVAPMPENVQNSHFGPGIITFILYQHYKMKASQPDILAQLRSFGVSISSGQISNILIQNKDHFHEEKEGILKEGLRVSPYINADDTGARHKGENGYCTYVGNEIFAFFESAKSKSRINFLEILSCFSAAYVINKKSFLWMEGHKTPKKIMELLKEISFDSKKDFEKHLDELGIKTPTHRRIITESALIEHLCKSGFDSVVVSDDAGQFNLFEHGLCWIHVERKINSIIPLDDRGRQDLKKVRKMFWDTYKMIKDYKENKDARLKTSIRIKFNEMCAIKTSCIMLENALIRIKKNKKDLLLVLKYPDIPVHNNQAERDIREYVRKRKISGGTRSDLGRKSRDTFASLIKTSAKLGINIWHFLRDRVEKGGGIPMLWTLLEARATTQWSKNSP